MKQTTLCFCVKDDRVLLAMKKRGFGAGKWNGYGGKVQEGERPKTAAVRELVEESGLVAREEDLVQVALVRFYFDEQPLFECSVYMLSRWDGEPIETEEMAPRWYALEQIPYDEMWAADAAWIPRILNGETIEAEINFNADGTIVKEFVCKPATFI